MFITVLIAFFVIMVLVSIHFSKKITTVNSLMLGDKKLPWYVNSATLSASYIGSGALVGGAALAYNVGYNALWIFAGGWIAIGMLFLMSTKIRKFAGTTNAELIGARFGDKARLLASVIVILAETAIVGYNIKGTGWVINITTNLNVEIATIIAAVLIIGFTVIAGYLSVAYTDLIQGIVITIAIIVALPFALKGVGGWEAVKLAIPPENLNPLKSFSLYEMLKTGLPTLALVFMGQAFWQRLFAANSTKDAKKASLWWLVVVVILSSIIMTLAVIGRVRFPDVVPSTIIMHLAKNGLPLLVGIPLLAACTCILVTTADSFLLASTTVFINDIYTKLINPSASEEKKVNIMRIAVIFLGILAFIQVKFFPTILSMVFYAYTMEGGLIVVVLAAFFWKRATITGGVLSISVIGLVTILWEIFHPFGIATIFATLVFGAIALVLGSLLTPPPEQKYLKPFET